jgi:nucleoside-diphosphate-sugar epimerase
MSYDHESGYVGKNVLVTGGAGFIGLNLVGSLLELGATVTALDYALCWEAEEMANRYRGRLKLIQGDIRDDAKVEAIVRGQDVLFDLAGKSGAADSNNSPLMDLDVNCRGHLTILEACRRVNPMVSLVFPSSRLVYGKSQYLPVDEQHPLAPESIYAAHKLTVETYVQIYARLYGLHSTVLRISNPFGPLQGSDARNYGIVNQFVQKAVNGQVIKLFGDGSQKRDFLFIEDLVEALLSSGLRAGCPALLVNIGGCDVVSMKHLAEKIVKLSGSGSVEHVPWPEAYQKVETGDYQSSLERASSQLGWKPETKLDDGLKRTIEFYQAKVRDC